MKNPYAVVADLEAAVCEYTGAPFCVVVNSCTSALLLALAWHLKNHPKEVRSYVGGPDPDHDPVGFAARTDYEIIPNPPFRVEIPKRTYVSVPMSIIHAGGRPVFRDEDWLGAYQLKPLPVWDSARRFTSGMYADYDTEQVWRSKHGAQSMMCVSFHATKIVGDTQGGAILHNDLEADAWLRRARFDGRTERVAPKDDHFTQIGYHCYMSPDVAAKLLLKMWSLPKHNADLPNDDYPDLSTMEIFK